MTYKPNNDIAIYASQTESLSRGAVVVNGSRIYDNAGDTLAPSTSKQREIGIKYNFENIFTTLAYFDIDTESLIDKELDNGLYHRVADGRDNYKGWEWTVNGQPADKWTVTGGLLYMNGKREKLMVVRLTENLLTVPLNGVGLLVPLTHLMSSGI